MSKRFWVFLIAIIVLGLGAGAWVFAQGDSGVPTAGNENFPDRKSTRLNSSHIQKSRMPSSA